MDQLNNLFKNLRPDPFDLGEELFDFLFLRPVDDELIGFFHVVVDFFGEFSVREQCVTDLDIAVVFVLALLIKAQELDDVFVGLRILGFELFKPPLGLLDVYLFYAHDKQIRLLRCI